MRCISVKYCRLASFFHVTPNIKIYIFSSQDLFVLPRYLQYLYLYTICYKLFISFLAKVLTHICGKDLLYDVKISPQRPIYKHCVCSLRFIKTMRVIIKLSWRNKNDDVRLCRPLNSHPFLLFIYIVFQWKYAVSRKKINRNVKRQRMVIFCAEKQEKKFRL